MDDITHVKWTVSETQNANVRNYHTCALDNHNLFYKDFSCLMCALSLLFGWQATGILWYIAFKGQMLSVNSVKIISIGIWGLLVKTLGLQNIFINI